METNENTTENLTDTAAVDISAETETHDADWYAKDAYECFIANADKDTSDADPVAAIQRVFNERANDQLKEQVAAEGKTAEGAYQFLWAVASLCKQTDGGCHISPETGYAIAMHYFQDVPAAVLDEFEPAMKKAKAQREAAERKEKSAKLAEEAKVKAKKAKEKSAKQKDTKKPSEPTPAQNAQEGTSTPSEQKPTNEPPKAAPKPQKSASAQSTLFDALFA